MRRWNGRVPQSKKDNNYKYYTQNKSANRWSEECPKFLDQRFLRITSFRGVRRKGRNVDGFQAIPAERISVEVENPRMAGGRSQLTFIRDNLPSKSEPPSAHNYEIIQADREDIGHSWVLDLNRTFTAHIYPRQFTIKIRATFCK